MDGRLEGKVARSGLHVSLALLQLEEGEGRRCQGGIIYQHQLTSITVRGLPEYPALPGYCRSHISLPSLAHS